MKKIFPIAAVAGLFFSLAAASHSNAAAVQACPSPAKVSAFSTALKAAQSETDYATSVKEELRARKDFLNATLDCAEQEVSSLQGQLAAIKTDDGDMTNLAKLFASRLQEATSYYESQRSALGGAGVRGSQDIARAIRDWRAGVFASLAGNVSNLELWVKNRELLQTAQSRFAQVEHTIAILKLSDTDDIQSTYEAAQSALSAAQAANSDARHILLISGSPDDSLAAIKDCLKNLSLMYQGFFTISESVDKLLTK